jgi:dihydrofolate reductase
MDPNRVIGYKGRMPWHISDDFKYFKKMTLGHPLVMGRSTFDSLGGKPLPGRFTYVLTTDETKLKTPPTDLFRYVSMELLLALFNQDLTWQLQRNDLWVCGGARVYKELLPQCDQIYMSHIMECYEGDTFMPEFETNFPHSQVMEEFDEFWAVKHLRFL